MFSSPDFTQHNEEAQAVWDAYRAGKPTRVPVTLWADARYYLLNPDFNPGGRITFQDYSEDPDIMLDVQLRGQEFRAFHVAPYCDDRAGMPEKFFVSVDQLRYFDAGFFGAKVEYREGQMPDTLPILQGDHKNLLFDQGIPDPLTGGVFALGHRLHEALSERIEKGLTYRDRPVILDPFGLGTDGPFTVAQSLRGNELYTDLYTDPDYVHNLLNFITEATIARILAHRKHFSLPELSEYWSFADDAIQMISTKMVKEFVLPVHKKLKAALTTAERITIHLCGDATRHFKLLRDELGCYAFDTGFPVDFAWLRQELGPEVEIFGGPRVPLIWSGPPQAITDECQRILRSGVMEGGRFILREANDLAPNTPEENLQAVYDSAKIYGQYSR
ncbi:MAG TPA: uroporphyrinogen decarboxylase family protein [Anaerolineales bacterium]|nr:uroporphyrinogen decarboxylase family protein [Anaerolineales bacterium]